MVRSLDHIPEHRAGGRAAARSPSVDHQLTGCVALDEHGIERTPHARERVLARHHRRVDADRYGVVVRRLRTPGLFCPLRHCQKLHLVPEPVSELDVARTDGSDPLPVDVTGNDVGVEGDAGQDCSFRRRVEALDVRRRIGLSKAEGLRLRERLRVPESLLAHPREHVVGRAVHDACQSYDPLACERLLQQAHERDRTGDGRFE